MIVGFPLDALWKKHDISTWGFCKSDTAPFFSSFSWWDRSLLEHRSTKDYLYFE